MKLVSMALAGACALLLAATATAVAPQKNAVLIGTVKASPFDMTINMAVDPTGTKLRYFTYLCGTGRAPTSVYNIPIDSTGGFTYAKLTGGTVLNWKIAGRFTSPTTAHISINSIDCGGGKGSGNLSLKTSSSPSSPAATSQPQKGAVLVGDVASSPFPMHMTLTVDPTGTKVASFTYLCGTGRPPTTVRGIPIDSTGHFTYAKLTGGTVLDWKIAGHFTSPTTAHISINSIDCGGGKGSTNIAVKS
jgi:hypothetical protein